MQIHNKLITKVNGPGSRAAVWVEGCDLGCRGCWNSALWPQDKPDNESVFGLAIWILDQVGIEGVTWSGGEPMQQSSTLLEVMRIVKENKPELTFGMFTGYNLDELESGRFKIRTTEMSKEFPAWPGRVVWKDHVRYTSGVWQDFREMLDFAVMGRFQDSKVTTADPMRSSTNQKLHLFSDRYQESDFKKQAVEIRIKPGGLTTITGFPVGVKGL